jgi:hypothetical protein
MLERVSEAHIPGHQTERIFRISAAILELAWRD